jgi:hypothetical protein
VVDENDGAEVCVCVSSGTMIPCRSKEVLLSPLALGPRWGVVIALGHSRKYNICVETSTEDHLVGRLSAGLTTSIDMPLVAVPYAHN